VRLFGETREKIDERKAVVTAKVERLVSVKNLRGYVHERTNAGTIEETSTVGDTRSKEISPWNRLNGVPFGAARSSLRRR
jgi:hypothetical protein